MRLGDFGTQRPPADDEFGYFGHTIRVHPDFSDVVFLESFAESAAAVDVGQVEAVNTMMRTLIHPEDFEQFWKLVRANRQQTEDLATLAMDIMESITDRPTERPSDSSDGPRSTDENSPVVSSSPVVRRLESQGRPDLALMVVQTQEHLSA